MSRFNQAIHNIKIKNYHTPPVNEAQFDNPYLLKSDTQALNDILAHLQAPPPIQPTQPQSTPQSTPQPISLIPTGVEENPEPPMIPTDVNPQEAESGTGNQDNGPPLPTSGSGNEIPTVTTPHDQAPVTTPPSDDSTWDDGDPTEPIMETPNPQDDMNLEEIIPAQATTTDGSTVSSGAGLIVDGKINSAIGLPESLRTQLTSSNGRPLRQVNYNPTNGKYTLYYGTRLPSGNYPGRVELSAPAPAAQTPAWYEAAGLAYYHATLDPRSGANYMLDQIANSGAHRNRFGP